MADKLFFLFTATFADLHSAYFERHMKSRLKIQEKRRKGTQEREACYNSSGYEYLVTCSVVKTQIQTVLKA